MNVIIRIVKARFRLLLAAFAVGVLIGIPAARLMPLSYVASMTVTPARYASDTKPATQTGVVSLLSTGADAGELSDFAFYLQLLTSQQVAEALFKYKPDIVHQLYKGQWKGDHWEQPPGVMPAITRAIYSLMGAPAWEPPSPLDLSTRLSTMISVEKSARSPVATVSVRTGDRAFGIALLVAVHSQAEAIMKYSARTRSEIKAQFLMNLLSKTPGVGVNDAIVQAEIRNQIAAAVTRSPVPFAAEFIAAPDAPLVPDRRSRLTFPLFLGLLGAIGTLAYLLLRHWRDMGSPLPAGLSWLRT
jgi:hypothetical protein